MRLIEPPEAQPLCDLLADLIQVNTGERPNPGTRWLTAARLLLTHDDYSSEQVEYLVRWSQANEFWRSNILSMPKLREKRLTLVAQIQRERANDHDRRRQASVEELLVGDGT